MVNSRATYIAMLLLTALLSSCYHRPVRTSDAFVQYSEEQLDSISFQTTHHYTDNYNFVVRSDSMALIRQQPEEYLSMMPVDTFHVYRHEPLVVADIRIMPIDSVDTVWVQLARDQFTFGWSRESTLLKNVSPDDPISQFITVFSNVHLLIFLVVISLFAFSYLLLYLQKKKAPLVHFRDIDSFYPTLLALLVAASATFYASIQMFAPDTWQHFYYYPTLNPFGVPVILGIFLVSVWAILIIGIATFDDVLRHLSYTDSLLYLSGLFAVCALNYIIFSITTLYYIGYFLWVVYAMAAIWRYLRRHRTRYLCGNCNHALREKGRCPYCGTVNE
ncbi:MAG: zinc ribbon domain-containing protein [Prevotella sp.]|nr:zinc ribbon domain-containing protein [Prevotella sp.]